MSFKDFQGHLCSQYINKYDSDFVIACRWLKKIRLKAILSRSYMLGILKSNIYYNKNFRIFPEFFPEGVSPTDFKQEQSIF